MRSRLYCGAIGILASLTLAACVPPDYRRDNYYRLGGYEYPNFQYGAYNIYAPPPPVNAESLSLSQVSYNFVFNLALNDSYEIEAGEMAVQRSASPQIRQFASRVIAGNKMANQDLITAMRRTGTPVVTPTSLDTRYQVMISELGAVRGREFDRRYVFQQVIAHREAIALLQDYVRNGDNPALRQLAQRTLQAARAGMQVVRTLPGGAAAGT